MEKVRHQWIRWATRRRTYVNHCGRIEMGNDDIKTGVESQLRDKGAPLGVPSAREQPARCLGGVRCGGGVSSSQALAWNRRTCRLDTDGQSKWVKSAPWSQEGEPQGEETPRGRVPMRGTGADRLVVAMKAL